MHIVEKRIWIDRPVVDVFQFHANHANRADWHEHVTRSEQTTSGPIGVGSRFAVETVTATRPVPMDIEIIAYDPPSYYAYRSAAAGAITVSHQTFSAKDGGTRFDVRIELSFRGWARPFGRLILKLGLGKHFDQALHELKAKLEQ